MCHKVFFLFGQVNSLVICGYKFRKATQESNRQDCMHVYFSVSGTQIIRYPPQFRRQAVNTQETGSAF